MTNNSVSKSATSRQLWALYCITKKDHRGMNLSYDEASKMIKELGNPDYKKAAKGNTLEAEFIEYFKANIMPKVVASLREALGIESAVVEDTNWMKGTGPNGEAKVYKFRGFGCSISYLTYDKRSKKAKEIEELFRSLRFKKFEELVVSQFPAKLRAQLKAEGTPIEALYCQDFDVNSTLYWGVVNFAKSQGVKKIDYVTRLD